MLLPSNEHEFCRVAREFHIELLTREAKLSVQMEIPHLTIQRTTVLQYLVNPDEAIELQSALAVIAVTGTQIYADTRNSFMRFRDNSDLAIHNVVIWDMFFEDVALMVLDYIYLIREQVDKLTIPEFHPPPDDPTGQQMETLMEAKIDIEQNLLKIESFLETHYFVAYAT